MHPEFKRFLHFCVQFLAFLHVFKWFWMFLNTLFCANLSGSKLCQRYFVSFFHLWWAGHCCPIYNLSYNQTNDNWRVVWGNVQYIITVSKLCPFGQRWKRWPQRPCRVCKFFTAVLIFGYFTRFSFFFCANFGIVANFSTISSIFLTYFVC